MKIEDKFKVYFVTFDNRDFNTGTAERAMALIKGLPKGGKKYYNKRWTIWKDKMPPDFISKLMDCQEESDDNLTNIDEFDVEKWKRQTFDLGDVV